jgi:hypothetical protein
MAPNFGTQIDGGEWARRWYRDHVKVLSSERGDEMWECLREVLGVGYET